MATTRQSSGTTGALGIAAVTVLTLLAVWAATAAGPWRPSFTEEAEEVPLPSESPSELVPPLPEFGESDVDARSIVLLFLAILLIIVLLASWGVALPAVQKFTSRGRADGLDDIDPDRVDDGAVLGEIAPDVEELREGVAQAWLRLAENRSPTDAVTAAWVALEDAAGRSGVPRDPAATPTEFTVAVLDRTEVDPWAIRSLLALYHRARFSTHGATSDDVAEAGRSLQVLAEGLGQ